MEKYLDIDYLKSLNISPNWFGLGFIQLKLNFTQRIHFYHPELLKNIPDEEVHDHRYDFVSHILKGKLIHEVWEFNSDPKGDYDLVEVSCKPDAPTDPTPIGRGTIINTSRYEMAEGSQYSIHKDLFHKVATDGPTITFLERGPVLKDTARVIKEREAVSICPFSVKIPEDELWRYMDECINGIPNGYHRSKIQKGILGESSKILEEVQELIDAELQKNKIMALVELSDLVGAIQHYVEQNYANINLSDLEIMANVTKRAFKDGRR